MTRPPPPDRGAAGSTRRGKTGNERRDQDAVSRASRGGKTRAGRRRGRPQAQGRATPSTPARGDRDEHAGPPGIDGPSQGRRPAPRRQPPARAPRPGPRQRTRAARGSQGPWSGSRAGRTERGPVAVASRQRARATGWARSHAQRTAHARPARDRAGHQRQRHQSEPGADTVPGRPPPPQLSRSPVEQARQGCGHGRQNPVRIAAYTRTATRPGRAAAAASAPGRSAPGPTCRPEDGHGGLRGWPAGRSRHGIPRRTHRTSAAARVIDGARTGRTAPTPAPRTHATAVTAGRRRDGGSRPSPRGSPHEGQSQQDVPEGDDVEDRVGDPLGKPQQGAGARDHRPFGTISKTATKCVAGSPVRCAWRMSMRRWSAGSVAPGCWLRKAGVTTR